MIFGIRRASALLTLLTCLKAAEKWRNYEVLLDQCDKTQLVNISDAISEGLKNRFTVPQGSTLYISDLGNERTAR